MNTILEQIEKLLMHEQNFVLCSVISSLGSSPAKTGALMLVSEVGLVAGTVGGGNLEFSCVEVAKQVLHKQKSEIQTFDLGKNGNLSMVCGGTVSVAFDFIDSVKTSLADLKQKYPIDPEKKRVLVFGAGHIGCKLVEFLNCLDFEVLQFDDRPDFAINGCKICNYNEISKSVKITGNDYVVVMSHGHLSDAQILLQVCSDNPAFIGCIGSKKKALETKNLLVSKGISDDIVNSISCPVGLPIGGDSPAEIALSIAAQLVQKRSEQRL